jgi:tetratricopeptide (TPR) repeat protein
MIDDNGPLTIFVSMPEIQQSIGNQLLPSWSDPEAIEKLFFNWNALREARDSYQKTIKTNNCNTYVQGNLARLDLILSKVDPERFHLAMKEFSILEALCRLDLNRTPNDYWRWFDRADSYLLTGQVDEGYHLYTKAIELVPLEYRQAELSIVMAPLINFLSLDVLPDDSVRTAVQKVVEALQLLISGQISHAKFSSTVEEPSVDAGRTQPLVE